MAGFWSIVIPEATTNIVTNPSVYTDTTGFTAVGATIVRYTTYMRREIACLKITPTAGVNDGAYYGTVTLTSGTSYTFSVDIYGVDGKSYKIYFGDTSAVVQGTATTFTATGAWERQEVTWTCDSTTTYRLYVTKNNDNNTSAFYIDGLHCEAKSYSTTYVDGDQEGCKWTGAEHASTSTRDAQSRAGGKLHNLDEYGFHVDDMPGIGMPPILHQTQEQPMLPGSLLRGFKTQPRVFDLIATQIGTTHEDLHSKRKGLLNAIKPDLVLEPQPFILQYTGANAEKPIEIKVVYDSGYQFTQLDGFSERALPLRFIAYDDPFFYEVGDAAAALTTSVSFACDSILSNDNGVWSAMGVTDGGPVYAIRKYGSKLYIGGNYLDWNSAAAMDNIVSYDLTTGTYSALGTGANSAVYDILIAPNGDVYACGNFTLAGGIANTAYIAKWDGSNWTALGTGLNAQAWSLAMDSSGNLYCGGNFTSAGGVADTGYFAKWDGSNWSSMAVINGSQILDIAIDKSDNIYIGGLFVSLDGDGNIGHLAKYDGSTWSSMGTEPDQYVQALALDPSDNLYAGGGFATIGGTTAAYIAKWNGASWSALGSGLNAAARFLNYFDGKLHVGGIFTSAGGLSLADRVAVWNGSNWTHLDVDFPGTPNVYDIEKIDGIIYYGFSTSGNANISYLQTITNNGTRSAYPKMVFGRSGGTSVTVQWMKNETTGATLYLNRSLLDGETFTVDLTEGNRSAISSVFGSSWQSVLRGSDFGNFYLAPGENNITIFVNEAGSPTITAYMQWRNTHWSADGVAP